MDEIKQICLSKLFIKEAYLRYNPNMSSRAPGGIFGRTCSADIQVYGVASRRGISGKVIVIF